MLSKIVRPLVQTQIRLLANSMATHSILRETIERWLGYLGVKAQITQLEPISDQIKVSLTVGQPESCDPKDWQKILQNLRVPNKFATRAFSESGNDSKLSREQVRDPSAELVLHPSQYNIPEQQQTYLARLLACLIQVGYAQSTLEWEVIKNHLAFLNLDSSLVAQIRSALKVPQEAEQLIGKLDPDVVAIALPIVVSVSLLDGQINLQENQAITALLKAMK